MKDLENKSSAELRQMLDDVQREENRISVQLTECMETHDLSAKATDKFSRLQTQNHLLWIRGEKIRQQLAIVERDEFAAEAERLRGDIQRLETEHAAAIEKTFAAVYPVLRYRDSAGHEWHERRSHEVRHLCKTAHEPGEIEARLHDAKAHLEQTQKELAKMDAQQVED